MRSKGCQSLRLDTHRNGISKGCLSASLGFFETLGRPGPGTYRGLCKYLHHLNLTENDDVTLLQLRASFRGSCQRS